MSTPHTDPEPDRVEAASRPSAGWDQAATVMPLIEQLDTLIEALGCGNGLHEWIHEYTGDPPGHPDRRLAWSRDRIYCGDCGQSATVALDAPPPGGFKPPAEAVPKLDSVDEVAQALADGRNGSMRWVAVNTMSAKRLWTTVRAAFKNIDTEPGQR